MQDRKGAQAALIALGAGGTLALAATALIAARPAAAAPENEKLDYLIDLQSTMVLQLQTLVEIGERFTMPELVLPAELTLKFPEAVIVVPPDPEMLGNIIMLTEEYGRFFIPVWRTALACPAGVTTTLPLNIPPGWVTYRRKPLELSSDFYDPLVGVNIYSDGTLINPVAPMPLTGPFIADMGEYITQWRELLVEVVNGTAFNAVVTIQIVTYLLDSSFWDEFIAPLIKNVRLKVERIVKPGLQE